MVMEIKAAKAAKTDRQTDKDTDRHTDRQIKFREVFCLLDCDKMIKNRDKTFVKHFDKT